MWRLYERIMKKILLHNKNDRITVTMWALISGDDQIAMAEITCRMNIEGYITILEYIDSLSSYIESKE